MSRFVFALVHIVFLYDIFSFVCNNLLIYGQICGILDVLIYEKSEGMNCEITMLFVKCGLYIYFNIYAYWLFFSYTGNCPK